MQISRTGSGLTPNVRNFRELETFKRSYFEEFADRDSSISLYYLLSLNPGHFKREIEEVALRTEKFNVNIEQVDETDDQELYSLSIRHEKTKHVTTGNLLAVVNHRNNIVSIITDEGSGVVESCVKITDRMYPVFERLHISSDMMMEVLSSFLDAGYSGRCRQYSSQRWWEEGHKPKTYVEYPTDIPLEVVLEELRKPSISLNMFHGYLDVDDEEILEFYINRDGELKYEYGRYEIFEEILNGIEEYALAEIEKFKNISKTSSEPYLEITFRNIVEEKEQDIIIDRFREAVNNEDTFAEGVIHSGNPYYHSSLSDRENGSSFDIIFSREGDDFQLDLLPNYDLSTLSILKFKKAIFSEFGEGEIQRMSLLGGQHSSL